MNTTGYRLYKITITSANKPVLPNLLVLTPNNSATRAVGYELAGRKARRVLKRKTWSHLVRPSITAIDYVGTIDA